MISVGIVVVTHNRAKLLNQSLDALLLQNFKGEIAIYVIDNASTDHTRQIVEGKNSKLIHYIYSELNLGGAGGFRLGVQTAYQNKHHWVWLMDDDVVPSIDCLRQLLIYADKKVLMPARENQSGDLVEYSALKYNLTNPFLIQPKRLQVCDKYLKRKDLPELLEIKNFSFEGILIHYSVIEQVGYPFAEYFISGDDIDYAERIKRKGYSIYLVKSAKLLRLLDFNKDLALRSWKGYYMYRNFFVIHFLYGKNFLVKLKPYLLILGALLTRRLTRNSNISIQLLQDAKNVAKEIRQNWL